MLKFQLNWRLIMRTSLGLLICLFVILSYNIVQAETQRAIMPITSEDFLRPIWHPDDAIVNAGELGRYRFSLDKPDLELPNNVKIRPELIKLLNDLQREFNTPMIIMSGYRSQEQDIYLWARWLSDNPKAVKAINKEKVKSWEEWVSASKAVTKIFPICTKHQTGDAVDFYWKGLDFQTEKKRNIMIALINEIAGSRKYNEEERQRYGIEPNDDNLLKVVAYMPGENINIFNPNGYAYFHVEYQPSEFPPKPSIDKIGVKLSEKEELGLAYKSGEYVLVRYKDFLYLARVVEDSNINDLEVNLYIFCDEIRDEVGDKVPKSIIHVRRSEPKEGWGNRKVMLEYLSNNEWKPASDVLEFEEYYVIPNQDGSQSTVSVKNVRFPVAVIH